MLTARAAGINFFYWPSGGPPSESFAADFKQLATSAERDSLFIAANAKTDPAAVRGDVEQTLSDLGLKVLDALVVQYIKPEEEDEKVNAALAVAHELKTEGIVRHVAASTHSFDVATALISAKKVDCIMLRY